MTLFNEILGQIPEILRQTRLLAFVRALLSALQIIQATLDGFIFNKRYELQFNGQVIYLEHRLNDGFDNDLRRIYIGDAVPNNVQPTIVTNRYEGQPTLIVTNITEAQDTSVFYNTSELQSPFDFIVFVPTDVLTGHENSLRALVDFYRIAGKIWTFQTF